MHFYVSRRWPLVALALAAALTLGAGERASAQQGRTLFGSSGSTGGGTTSGVSGAQNQGTLFGSSQSAGQNAAGGGGMQAGGGAGAGGGGAGGLVGSAPSLLGNTLQSAAGNLGAGMRTGGGFVGNTGADQGAGQGSGRVGAGTNATTRNNRQTSNVLRRGTTGGFGSGGLGGQRGLNPNFAGGQGGRGSGQSRQVRFTYRMAFVPAALPTPADAAQRVSKQLTGATPLADASGLSAQAEGGVVVLRGEVASEYDRRLAELVAKLEPGVREVRNELVVASAPQ